MTTIVLLPPVPPGQLRTVRLREADSIPPRGLGCVHGRIQLVQEFFDRVLAPGFQSDAHPCSWLPTAALRWFRPGDPTKPCVFPPRGAEWKRDHSYSE
jgi:hypothetical protein